LSLPVLETERLYLRQLSQQDAKYLFDYFSKDEVTKYYDIDSLTDISQAKKLIQHWQNSYMNEEGMRWGLTLKGEKKVIGTCGFHKWSKKHFKAEIGYDCAPAYWQKGLMTEAIQALTRYGFEALGLNRMEALVHHENVKSIQLLDRSGFKQEGLLKEYYCIKQSMVDTAIFSLLKRDWKMTGEH